MPDDARVLDPFAGSGTTGHAVALQNAADGGGVPASRSTPPEPVRPGSNADLAGYARVSDVTRARLRAVADVVGGGFAEGGHRRRFLDSFKKTGQDRAVPQAPTSRSCCAVPGCA